jgi:hypothetical protein
LRVGLTAALLGTTAVTGAFAQSGQPATGDVKTCDDLRATLEQHADLIKPDMRTDANKMVTQGDDQKCVDFFKEAAVDPNATAQPGAQPDQTAEAAGQQPAQQQPDQPADQTAQANTQTDAQGRIVVTQPEPAINVQQPAPQVAVRQQQPQVTVNQGQPQIEVHQAQPTIHVQMPQPIITIDQPQPQIIVRMPNPQVAVNAPQPQIEVHQAQPTVTVEQAQPKVQVLGNDQDTAVNVEQQQPKVVQQTAEGQPNVQVQRAQPKVQYFPAEPKVAVEASGKPQIKFNQSGKPDIQIEQLQQAQETSATAEAGANQQPGANQPGQPDNSQQVASTNPQGQQANAQANPGGNGALALILLPQGQQPPAAGQPKPYQPDALIGQQVTNWNGENLGTVKEIAADGTRQFIVLAPDTPLGDGQQAVILPLETIAFVDNKLVMQGMTEQQASDLSSYDTSKLKNVEAGQQVNVATR